MAWVLFFALLLDAALGEPKWLWSRLPHPAVLMGRAVTLCTSTLNHGRYKKIKGALTLIILIVLGACLGQILGFFGPVAEVLCAAVLLAQKSLVQHVRAVGNGARYSLREGRRAVAMIVGRDTDQMDQHQMVRAAIESGAENLSDGVVAPAFWLLLGGLPGLLIYKLVNTADSMIGYKTPALAEFGWAAARFDDLLNWVPARITAALIAIQGGVIHDWRAITKDARQHRSPNAGWPEAAMARALGVALAGPRSYEGTQRTFAWVNPHGNRAPTPNDIDRSVRMLWTTWALMLGFVLLIAVLG
ncbi:adenosylcobinamide-phosphate synthase CbiB [Rhodobacteraceae bacterium]|nr:adenosylcobinamide-phosphate synthase CbiB [Paracoccaceae bacterium]